MKKFLKPAISHQNWLDASETVLLKIRVRPYSMKELCQLYNLSYKSMVSSMMPFAAALGKRQGRFYNVHQVETIFMHLGIPYSIHEKQSP